MADKEKDKAEKDFQEGFLDKIADNYQLVKEYVKERLSDTKNEKIKAEQVRSAMEFYDKYGELPDHIRPSTPKDVIENAYDAQKKIRDDNPAIDAALNFVPVAGTVATADDLANDIKNKEYQRAAMDAVGLVPGGGILTKATLASLDLLKDKIHHDKEK